MLLKSNKEHVRRVDLRLHEILGIAICTYSWTPLSFDESVTDEIWCTEMDDISSSIQCGLSDVQQTDYSALEAYHVPYTTEPDSHDKR